MSAALVDQAELHREGVVLANLRHNSALSQAGC